MDATTSLPAGLGAGLAIQSSRILHGITALPEGRRRAALAAAAEAMFTEDFAGRILPFEAAASARYAGIVLARRNAGNPIEKFDALVAAIALAAGAESPRATRADLRAAASP